MVKDQLEFQNLLSWETYKVLKSSNEWSKMSKFDEASLKKLQEIRGTPTNSVNDCYFFSCIKS